MYRITVSRVPSRTAGIALGHEYGLAGMPHRASRAVGGVRQDGPSCVRALSGKTASDDSGPGQASALASGCIGLLATLSGWWRHLVSDLDRPFCHP